MLPSRSVLVATPFALAAWLLAWGAFSTTAQAAGDDAAQTAAAGAGKDSDKDADKKKEAPAPPSVTRGRVTIDGREIAYTATAGKMLMTTDEGDPKAHVFYVAYTVDEGGESADEGDDDDASETPADAPVPANRRPITFCFNGGPGSSSVWLHLGMLGPVRVKLDSDARPLPPPHELIANPHSLLDVTDLVFIDPVSTGFSRPAKGESKQQFHGYNEDIRSVAQFIHDFTSKYARWGSPKFLVGESYGGLRAAGLVGELRDLELNGIALISAVVDFQKQMTNGNNDIAYALFLPSFAASAWYHKALSDELQQLPLVEVVAQAEEFAVGPYLRALAAGDSLPEARRQRVVRRMAQLTGLSEEYIEGARLRVTMRQFGKQLLRDQRRLIGRFDSRYTGLDRSPLAELAEYDPSAEAVFGTFTSALNDYVRTTLKVEEPRVYEILTGAVQPWDYGSFANRYVDASDTLRMAMTQNPHLKVFAACGYYDLATPHFAMQYTRDHLGLAPEVRDNFSIAFYDAGHMMYAHEPSLVQLRADMLDFYADALPAAAESDPAEDD
ncbi:MAG TPA: peptidase S10 [Lacipirellulaceae bacterium]|nr:peptidase S10 [Lacipirellulaceae bacterium]